MAFNYYFFLFLACVNALAATDFIIFDQIFPKYVIFIANSGNYVNKFENFSQKP